MAPRRPRAIDVRGRLREDTTYTATTHTRALYVQRTLYVSPLQTGHGIHSHAPFSVSAPPRWRAVFERRSTLCSVSPPRDQV